MRASEEKYKAKSDFYDAEITNGEKGESQCHCN